MGEKNDQPFVMTATFAGEPIGEIQSITMENGNVIETASFGIGRGVRGKAGQVFIDRLDQEDPNDKKISAQQEQIGDKLFELIDEIEKHFPEAKYHHWSSILQGIVSYTNIMSEELHEARTQKDQAMQDVQEWEDWKVHFLGDMRDLRRLHKEMTPEKKADMSKRHNLDMDAYNQGCVDTMNRYIKKMDSRDEG